MNPESLVVIGLVGLVAAALGYFISRTRSGAAQAALQQQLETTQRDLEARDSELAAKANLLVERDAQVQAQQTEIALANQKLDAAQQEEAKLNDALASQKARTDELQQQLSVDQKALSSTKASLEAEQHRLQEASETKARLQEELQQQRDKTAAVEVERNEYKESLASIQSSLASERKTNQERAETIERLRADIKQQQQTIAAVEEERNKLSKQLATTEVAQQEREEHFAKQLAQLEKSEERLKQEFKNLASDILQSTGKAFTEQNKTHIDALLNPFQKQINEFKGRVENLALEGTKQQTEMKTELKQLQAMHQKMTQEAEHLANALQGQKKVQGNWGELVLENVLDRSGLQLGKDYKREVSFTDEEGSRSRPDAIVYLPQGKHLIIDAKVSLAAYTRYVNAEDDLERQHALKEHVQAVSNRIKELSDRDYYKIKELNSPEMVFMFIPIESAYVEAFKADESLFQKALEQNVLVATPTTLLTSLNIVRQLWRFEDQNKHTAELADKAAKVYDKLRLFVDSMEGVGKSLDKARDSYDKAYGQLYSGRGNLIKQASEFQKLGVAVKTELPVYITDKADLELTHQQDAEDIPAIESPVITEALTEEVESV